MFAALEYGNFLPSPAIKTYGEVLMSQLQEELPEQFSTRGMVKRIRTACGLKYSCVVEIYSRWGLFIEESVGKDPLSAIDKAGEKMRDQISSWVLRRSRLQISDIRRQVFRENF